MRGGVRHRILGLIRFDSLVLGMQPGVISTRLGSLFRSEGESPSAEGGLSEGEGVCSGVN